MNWNPNDCWEFNVGLVNGWDAFDREEDRAAAIARAKYTHQPTGIWTSFAIITGEEFNNAAGLQIQPDTANRTRYSWLVDLPLSSRLEYVFHHWLGFQDDGAVGGGRARTGTESTSTYTTRLTIAGRLEPVSNGSRMRKELASG